MIGTWRSVIPIVGLAFLLGCGSPFSGKRKRVASPPADAELPASEEPTSDGSGSQDSGDDECKETAEQFELTYLEHVLPIVNKYCIGCHYPSAAAGGWILDRYSVTSPSQLSPVDAWKKVISSVESGRMPPNNSLTADELATLKKWMALGAPKQNAVKCETSSSEPPASLLSCDTSLAPENKKRVWRMTHSQWGHSTRAILGATHSEELNFASDPALYGFDNFAEALRITILQTNRYREATQRLANQILDVNRINALRNTYSPGWGTTNPDGDRDRFIKNFGFHLFRRPLTDMQVDLLRAVHVEGKKSGIGYKLLIEAMLQSPYFLFRREIGINGVLTQFEIADALSFTIWDESPDLVLLNLAAEGKLSGSVLEDQISRLLASEKAERLFTRFFGSLLDIKGVKSVSKDEALFPGFDDEVAALMYDEFTRMIRHVVTAKNSSMPALFKDLPSFTNSRLAPYHETSSSSQTLVAADLSSRGSLLTSLAFLTANSGAGDNNPFLRGKIIREKLLCMPLASPPANIPPIDDTPATGFKTRRERFAAHSNSPSCSGCHKMIDDLGFSFDNFDATGKFQTEAGGLPVDTKGEFSAFFDGIAEFSDAADMSKKLADSDHMAQCMSIQMFRYVRGREDAKHDGCQISNAHKDFVGDQTSLKSLVKSILTNPDFYRLSE